MSYPEKRLRKLLEVLHPRPFELKISRRKVPYIVSPGNVSVCYFKKSDIFRVFTNCGTGSDHQERYDGKTEEEVIHIIDNL